MTGARAASGSDPGRCVFNLQQGDELIRIKCNASAGHVMSKREVEAENTKMDEDECAAVSIITLGTVADEARSLAQKLALDGEHVHAEVVTPKTRSSKSREKTA